MARAPHRQIFAILKTQMARALHRQNFAILKKPKWHAPSIVRILPFPFWDSAVSEVWARNPGELIWGYIKHCS